VTDFDISEELAGEDTFNSEDYMGDIKKDIDAKVY
jgi:hypothetical protein